MANRVARVLGTTGAVRGTKTIEVGKMHLSGSYLAVYVLHAGRWQMLDQQSSPAFTLRAGPPRPLRYLGAPVGYFQIAALRPLLARRRHNCQYITGPDRPR